ncbi:hypothetical protein KEM48_009073 [Puccinia striiformis f. sp. tritici PST-130]|nr:hypothetical protein H4Q26_009467 [Puccinia striiformis f. sp. tritici PST-130]KAI9624176.1 hypothetical protein KEM48_009073 [Puccinia striiformis f. sp. tritici PST-130]
MIHAEAPHGPLFSLQESQIVLDQCRKALSDTEYLESEIQVWNMGQFQWTSLAPTCTLTYPLIPQKLLVQLEQVSAYNCTGLQDVILKMSTEGPYKPLTTPARCILASSNSASKTDSNHWDIEWIGSLLAPKGGPEVQTKKGKSHTKWPNFRGLLCQTLRWHASSKRQGHPRDAWDQFFGDMYDYRH